MKLPPAKPPRCHRCEDRGWAELADGRYPGASFARPCQCNAGLERINSPAWLGRQREALPALGQSELPVEEAF